MQCWGKGYHQRICKFYNLLLWNDTFYYPTSGKLIAPMAEEECINACAAKTGDVQHDIYNKRIANALREHSHLPQ